MNSSLWAYFESLLSLILMASALRISYHLREHPTSSPAREEAEQSGEKVFGYNPSPAATEEAVSPELAKAFPRPRIEAIKRKELRCFQEAQDKKWRRWMEAMSR